VREGSLLSNYYGSKNFDKTNLIAREEVMEVESVGEVPVEEELPLSNSAF
jgi:hypothetical protein